MINDELLNNLDLDGYYHLLAEYDCCIVETSLPGGCKGFTMKNLDDIGYVIYLNNNRPKDKMLKTLEHEFKHIRKGHFDSMPLYLKETR